MTKSNTTFIIMTVVLKTELCFFIVSFGIFDRGISELEDNDKHGNILYCTPENILFKIDVKKINKIKIISTTLI